MASRIGEDDPTPAGGRPLANAGNSDLIRVLSDYVLGLNSQTATLRGMISDIWGDKRLLPTERLESLEAWFRSQGTESFATAENLRQLIDSRGKDDGKG